jgi:hypothetical protein
MASLDSLWRARALLPLAAALLAALALGCRGGGEAPQVPSQLPPVQEEEPGVPREVEDELRSILARWGSRDARIVYKVSTVSGGVREEADLLFQWRPAQRQWRMDIAIVGGESGSIINDGQGLYLCDDAEHLCFKFSAEDSPVAPLPFVSDSQVLADPVAVAEAILEQLREGRTQVSSRTIANLAARCFTSTSIAGLGGVLEKLEVCLAVDTALLLRAEALAPAQGGRQDRSLFEATQVSGEVAANAFDPPYEVVDTEATPEGGS